MRSIPNVIRRGNVLHFRRAVPVELRAHLRRGELTRSLQTDSFKAAKVRSRALYIASEHLFDRVRVTPMLSDDQLAGLVQDFYATVIEQENAVRLNGPAFSEEMRQARIGYYAGVAATAKESLARNELAHGSFVAEAMLQKHRLSEKLTNAERNQVRQAMLRAGIDLAEHIH